MFYFYDWKMKNLEMFLDLCDVGNTVAAETFLEIICELSTGFEGACFISGKRFRQID